MNVILAQLEVYGSPDQLYLIPEKVWNWAKSDLNAYHSNESYHYENIPDFIVEYIQNNDPLFRNN